jgi:mono/diheme cytochrome c family protein
LKDLRSKAGSVVHKGFWERTESGTVEAMKQASVVLLALLLAWASGAAEEGEERDREIRNGRELYRIYCRNCHGESGQGDGPMVEVLTVRPADLTRLARDHDGEFPEAEIHSAIDGREELVAHGSSEMPVWGLAFQELDTDVDQEPQVRARIQQLVEYLRSIQAPAPTKK